jgi:hypothetical protein
MLNKSSQIRWILQLGFQLRFSSWHIAEWGLRTAHLFGWPVSELPTFAVAFLSQTANPKYRIYAIAFFGDRRMANCQQWKFVVRFSASESNWNRAVRKSARFKNLILHYGCLTQMAVALTRSIFYGKKGSPILILHGLISNHNFVELILKMCTNPIWQYLYFIGNEIFH